jgi:hypothetical protein
MLATHQQHTKTSTAATPSPAIINTAINTFQRLA